MNNVAELPAYVCDICGKRFKTKRTLSSHSRTHPLAVEDAEPTAEPTPVAEPVTVAKKPTRRSGLTAEDIAFMASLSDDPRMTELLEKVRRHAIGGRKVALRFTVTIDEQAWEEAHGIYSRDAVANTVEAHIQELKGVTGLTRSVYTPKRDKGEPEDPGA